MDEKESILFLGDVVPHKLFKFINHYPTVINLECPITMVGNPVPGKINLNASENHLNTIFNGKLISVSLGNNHILDYGKKGLESTLNELEKYRISWFGLNLKAEDNYQPLILEINQNKFAFLSAVCPSTSPVIDIENGIHLDTLDIKELIDSIIELRKSVNRIVIYIHWGAEESSYPLKEEIVKARKLIDAGADIIIGTHAHAPQPIEKYKNGIIAYNLGNFIMPALKNIPTYYDERGNPQSSYNKNLMLWNRISWGALIDMNSMEFKVKKYIFIFDRVFELPFTPLDKYIQLRQNLDHDKYEQIIQKHLKKRKIYRRIRDYINNPHIPNLVKNMVWK
ncbi:capsule synthesis protein PGA_cap [Tangfeifania diversioriginum]|uniref:Capsule synthesis protein PGA_cap n=1 Tax=Tangfeifania diversioriginum TaxID=1168035 RepID=A0A1M6GRE0_9BACT|nr:CapA family protein [Tangfeifania diversioriginum]SHJ12521.1 capsule synthesis protein PGA_cap [Tangfeifania diversioriginum]